ncbi:MAG: hypothetical protein K2L20_04605 [Ligilactobacillus sp.]|nr:hypothetical protein [Ligilactobacillus sp.]
MGTPISGIVGINVVLGSQSVDVYPLLNGGNFGIEALLPSFTYPHIFGLDVAGTVVVVGENVQGTPFLE